MKICFFYSLSIILYKRPFRLFYTKGHGHTCCVISMLFSKHRIYQVRSPPKCQSITTKLQFSTNNFSHPFDPWWFEWFGGMNSITYIISLLSFRFDCWVGGLHHSIKIIKLRTQVWSLAWARPCPIDHNQSPMHVKSLSLSLSPISSFIPHFYLSI